MLRTIARWRLWMLLVLLSAAGFVLPAGALSTAGESQVAIPAAALPDLGGLEQVLVRGAQLEQERRWSEALSHYEQAVREFPGRNELRQRLVLARMHFDLARRYADASFTGTLDRISEPEALDLYAEVLLKIQAHHVDAPDWQDLLRRGIQHLDVALSEPAFVTRHLPRATPDQLARLQGDLHRALDNHVVNNRQDARHAVAWAAKVASQQVGLKPQAVIMEYTCGATGALDEYSGFLTAAQLDDVFSQIEGNFVGLGIELKSDEQALLIVNVIAGGPAAQAGISSGDRIVEVDGQSTKDVSTEAAADMLKGLEGSLVDVTVLTAQGDLRPLRLKRQRVEVPSVDHVKILDGEEGVGYLRLTSFQKTTSRDLDAALWKLHREGMKYLIMDLRGNPGGLLTASVEVADRFISSGTIVSTRGRSPREDFDYKAHSAGTWRVPLIVLIDGESASASEIFAGAIRDHRRGTVVGQKSYGKGSVQGIFPLNASKAGVRLTTAKFYSPSGQPISRRGVSPDLEVHTVAKPQGQSIHLLAGNPQQDSVLQAALHVARQAGGWRLETGERLEAGGRRLE